MLDGKPLPPVAASDLKLGDVVEVTVGEFIPGDGEVIEGVATVDEAQSPAKARRSSAKRAATAQPSQPARASSPTGSSCG